MDPFLSDLLTRLGCEDQAETGEGIEARCGFSDCQSRKKSFRVSSTERYGSWICHKCHRSGGLTALIQEALGIDQKTAQKVAAERKTDRLARQLRPPEPEPETLGPRHIAPYRRVLSEYLVRRGYREEDIWYYRFGFDEHRSEIVAPTYSADGKLVGISRRKAVDGAPFIHDPFPKKSEHLFGLDLAIKTGCRTVVLTEGQTDPLGLVPYWSDSPVVASLGCLMSKTQSALLREYFDTVIIAYDNDEMGERGTRRAVQLLREKGVTDIWIMTYNPSDPGDFPRWLERNPGSDLGIRLERPSTWMATKNSQRRKRT